MWSSRTSVPVYAAALTFLLALADSSPVAAKSKCGSVAGDADAIAATRAAAEAQCGCAGPSHGAYVACVTKVVKDAVTAGSLRKPCSGEVVRCAARSSCGRQGFVTCCRTDAAGVTRCSIKRNADRCKAPKNGSRCIGTLPSCCDACTDSGCATTTTTTVAVTTTTNPSTTTTTLTTTTTTTVPTTTSTSTTTTSSTTTTTTSSTTTTSESTTTIESTTTTTTTEVPIQCCVQSSAMGAFDTCILETETGCAGMNGQSAGPGSCSPNPCPPSSTTTTTTMEETTTTTTMEETTTTTTMEETTTTETTTTTGTSSTTTTMGPTCCPAGRISTTTAAGVLVVGTLTAFPFPPGVITTIDLGAGDSCCKHDAIIPAGGFAVPVFCITGLNFSSQVTTSGCESGGADGNGSLWDGNSTCADADVRTVGDTSDGTCDPGGAICGIAAGGASNNTLGNIDTTIGDGSTDPTGVQVALAVPVHSRTWSAADASCPDSDGMYDAGTDTLVSEFDFILRPTTATANASFVDQNADSCSRGAGTSGPNNTRSCSNDHSKPCGANADCVSPGACGPTPNSAQTDSGALTGTPPAGPCCVPGQTETVVATGIAFSGGSPLFDLIFANSSPTTVDSCSDPVAGGACVLSTDTCKF